MEIEPGEMVPVKIEAADEEASVQPVVNNGHVPTYIDVKKEPEEMVPVKIEEEDAAEEPCPQFVVMEWSMKASPAPTDNDVEQEPGAMDPLQIQQAVEEACDEIVFEEWSMKMSPASTEQEPEEMVPVKTENAAEEACAQVVVEKSSTKKRRAPTCIDAENEPGEMIPVKIAKAAKDKACAQSLSEKSKRDYESKYKKFVEWKTKEQRKDSNEDTLLAYYNELRKTYAPSSIWTYFSMLKSTMMHYENVDIQNFTRLQNLLKKNCMNYQGKKSKTFTAAEIEKFFTEAPDDVYLAIKVATICEIWGACRRDELVNMKIDYMKQEGRLLVVDIPDTETRKARRFVIPADHVSRVKKYKALRPKNVTTDRFFLHYRRGKCTEQVIGKHKFATMPQDIARYLNIEDPENYTRHSKSKDCPITFMDVEEEPEAIDPLQIEEAVEEAFEEVYLEEWSMETSPASTCIDVEKEPGEVVPVEIAKAAEEKTCAQSLTEKSKRDYELKYMKFAKWKKENKIQDSHEDTLLAYYNELSKTYAPSSMWTFFSTLKSTLMLHENVDIQKYARLQELLRKNCQNYQTKKSKAFTSAEMEKFFTEAPDDVYLATKVASICKIWGGCRSNDLVKMKIDHIKEEGRLLIVELPDTETRKARKFVIPADHVPTVKKYKALRPKDVPTDRFFLRYAKGRCTEQVIGKHKFASMPQDIARYLNIEDPGNYTRLSKSKGCSTTFIDMEEEPEAMVPVRIEEAAKEACEKVVAEESSTKKRLALTCIDVGKEPGEMVPVKIAKTGEEKACAQSLPEKSKQNYESTYKKFAEWKKEKKIQDSSEDTLLVYYNELSKTYAPSSMWSFFSMLRSTIMLYENVNTQKYTRLQDLLKKNCRNCQTKKSKVFTAAEMKKFFTKAPDHVYLATKVATICEIWGGCRRNELVKMKVDHIKEEGRLLIVEVPATDTKKARRFVIPADFAPIVKKYKALRPKDVPTDRFFLRYAKGRCTDQVIGKHKFAAMPQDIARYLNIKDPENYTRLSKNKDSLITFIDMQKEPETAKIEEPAEEACAQFVVKGLSAKTSPSQTHIAVKKGPEEMVPVKIEEEEAYEEVYVEEWSMETSPAPTCIDVEKERGEVVPVNIAKTAEEKACAQSLPEKSKQHYESTYKRFVEWKTKEQRKDSNEDTLLAYYNEFKKTYAPSSMWSIFSMLRSTIILYENVDIQTYARLQNLLRKNAKNYQGKKSKDFTDAEIEKFFTEAPDYVYLATKVATIFEIWGACRRDELVNMKIDQVKKEGKLLVVDIPHTERRRARRFVIPKDHVSTVKRYRALRPKDVPHNRFFLRYAKGWCTEQVIGKHRFAAMPQDIARYLNIKDPENYTRHSKDRNCCIIIYS